jgi:type II secretory pathway component PulC
MKQQLWIVNSSLLGIFFIACTLLKFFEQYPPVRRPGKIVVHDSVKKKEPTSQATLEVIYKNDIFGTFIPQIIMPPAPAQAIKQSLVTPMPELQTAQVTPIPEAKKQEFIDALNLTLKGIVISSDELKNVVMIADETQKENLYHLGDKIKDAQIIKIIRNRVVFLRANGQQELFFLRKEDNPLSIPFEERWKMTVKQVNATTFEIDPEYFVREVDSLGNFVDSLPLVGTAYQGGSPIGIRVGNLEKQDIGLMLGLKPFDIIVAINDLTTAQQKNRLEIYDAVTQAKVGDTINVKVRRGQQDVDLVYKLSKLAQGKTMGAQPPVGQSPEQGASQTSSPQPPSGMSSQQERAAARRQFKTRHPNPQRQETMMEIRKRLLDNLRTRLQNSRVR